MINKIQFTSRLFSLFIFHVFFPISIGGLIYMFFRSKSLLMFTWFDNLGLNTMISYYRSSLIKYSNIIPDWVLFSLPDGLWVYSFSSSLLLLWGNDFKISSFWLFLPFLFGSGVEIMQKFDLVSGTFDIIDLIICLLASILSIIIVKPKI
jgi:hypothetical protein